jgi:hypothetical protein
MAPIADHVGRGTTTAVVTVIITITRLSAGSPAEEV